MNNKAIFGLIALLIVAVVGWNSLFKVRQIERVVLLHLGEIKNPDVQPGLHVKWPMIESVKRFDARILTLDAPPQRYLTSEKKYVVVDSFVKWRIAEDGLKKFYTASSGSLNVAAGLIASRVDTGLRAKFGERTLHEVISGERDELMADLTSEMDKVIREELGIAIVDVRVKGIEFSEEVSLSVYQRMRAERAREAQEHRSEGKELAEGIRADADRQRRVILAEAYKNSELTRGEGDALSAAIYAKAYNKDSEFYSFYRSLDAYKETFSNKGDVMLIDRDSEFFRYMGSSKGKN